MHTHYITVSVYRVCPKGEPIIFTIYDANNTKYVRKTVVLLIFWYIHEQYPGTKHNEFVKRRWV